MTVQRQEKEVEHWRDPPQALSEGWTGLESKPQSDSVRIPGSVLIGHMTRQAI